MPARGNCGRPIFFLGMGLLGIFKLRIEMRLSEKL